MAEQDSIKHAMPYTSRIPDDTILVTGKKGDILRKVTGEQSGIVDPSQMSVTRAINLVPSLSQQSVDPYGLADISNNHESFRFRGVEATAGGVPATPVNVEDVPVTGRPGGGPAIFDLENFRNIIIYTGGLAADKGFGIADVGGKINLNIVRPSDSPGITVKQQLGSMELFRRTFLRLNTGKLASTKGFVSYSNTYADKWKGCGNTGRDNTMIGITNTIADRVTLAAFGIYSNLKLNTYRPLTYAQISDIDANYDLDFSSDPGDYYYYDYNRIEFEDYMFLGRATVAFSDAAKLTVKPYFSSDEGYYLETVTQQNGQNRIRRWDIDHNLFGGLAQLHCRLAGVDYSAGYLYHNQERPGPPTSWKLYTIASGKPVFDKFSILSNNSRHEMHSPFLTAKYVMGSWVFDGGVRYMHYRLPAIITYKADSTWGDVSQEEALRRNPAIDEAASANNPKSFAQFFPNATLTRALTRESSLHLTYGKNYVTHVDVYPYFMSQRSTFQKAGITFKQLWDDREMEISHNFEFGFRHETGRWNVAPTVYYSIHKGKQAVLEDPVLGIAYPRNDADATGYGAEFETKINCFKNFSCYGSLSYNRFFFAQDIHSDKDSSVLHISGFQVPDAPEAMAKALLSYQIAGFVFSPIARLVSTRYGDILHKEKVKPSTAFDMDVSYSRKLFFLKHVQLAATFMNILRQKNTALINTSDRSTFKTSYLPVAPFTVIGSLILNY